MGRFLPPLSPGMARAWLEENIPAGSWVLDPLGASPSLVLEAAQAGYRVLVASNNPILSFMIETLAGGHTAAEYQAALADLAMSRRGDERMEKHIAGLYLTECENCGSHIPAQAFLWRKGEAQPYGRVYQCSHCNEAPPGERPVTKFDLDRLSAMGGDQLQRVRALQRVIMNEDERRVDVEEALESYLPRPLYVLFTLLNKIEGMGQAGLKTRLLQALLLNAFDAGDTLWPWPAGRSRPRQLGVPPQFKEKNLWMALEEAAGDWGALAGSKPSAIPVTRWPALPENLAPGQGAICLFRGRVKALMPLPATLSPRAVLTVYPRPSQAFWTLSVLWSGWLWGPEAALPIRNVLDRRRYDWNWHTSAVFSALSGVGSSLAAGTPFFGILLELAPGFLSAVLIANQASGFQMDGLALRSEEEIAQVQGRILGPVEPEDGLPKPGEHPKPAILEQDVRAAMRSSLFERGEPAPYLALYAAGLQELVRGGAFPRAGQSLPGDWLSRAHTILTRAFSDRSFLKIYGGPAEESGWWWLAGMGAGRPEPLAGPAAQAAFDSSRLPLADQVEVEVIRYLQKNSPASLTALDRAVCGRFPGLQTPPLELVRTCLASYAGPVADGPGLWTLGAGETAAARKADLLEIQAALQEIGRKLGYQVTLQPSLLTWSPGEAQAPGRPEWQFYLMASSIISRFVLAQAPAQPEHHVLVFPGSRAPLLSLKLRRDPRLAEAAQGWRFLKYRHLREIAARPNLNLALWESLLDEDPLTEEAHQMQLFS